MEIMCHMRTATEMKLKLICPELNNNWKKNFAEVKYNCFEFDQPFMHIFLLLLAKDAIFQFLKKTWRHISD